MWSMAQNADSGAGGPSGKGKGMKLILKHFSYIECANSVPTLCRGGEGHWRTWRWPSKGRRRWPLFSSRRGGRRREVCRWPSSAPTRRTRWWARWRRTPPPRGTTASDRTPRQTCPGTGARRSIARWEGLDNVYVIKVSLSLTGRHTSERVAQELRYLNATRSQISQRFYRRKYIKEFSSSNNFDPYRIINWISFYFRDCWKLSHNMRGFIIWQ